MGMAAPGGARPAGSQAPGGRQREKSPAEVSGSARGPWGMSSPLAAQPVESKGTVHLKSDDKKEKIAGDQAPAIIIHFGVVVAPGR